MDVSKLAVDRDKARKLYQDYKKHQHYSTPIDKEVQRTYQLIAQGKLVIRAIDSVVQAGLNEQGLPNLALAPATSVGVRFSASRDGSGKMIPFFDRFSMRQYDHPWKGRNQFGADDISFPPKSFDFPIIEKKDWRGRPTKTLPVGHAHIPLIPIHLRPKRGLANYHVLWEAEWSPVPPVDPYLLRRIGKADLWLVVAAWDLTEVEQAALASRVLGN